MVTQLQALLLRFALQSNLGSRSLEETIELEDAVHELIGVTPEALMAEVDSEWIRICEKTQLANESCVFVGLA